MLHYSMVASVSLVDPFGSFAVDLVVKVFPRLADVYNFDLVLRMLTASDVAALYCRLGLLNIFNPLKLANGFVHLTLNRFEERQVFKILSCINLFEKGLFILSILVPL